MRKLVVVFAALVAFAVAPAAANAAIPDALGISCTVQGTGPNAGQRWCGSGAFRQSPADVRSTVESFDGVPIDVNVAFPSTGGDGPYPLVMMFHGYREGKDNFPRMQRWLNKGYAVLAQTNRGFHESCGTPLAKAADVDCATKGFVRLDDTRYEVRDAQLFAGRLADAGLIQPTRIAVTGPSYGGGMSMALSALKNRVMNVDGTYSPWDSPNGTPMSIAVAIPSITWTDLAYSLAPNGSNIDYIKDASYFGRFGVMKQSYVDGLYLGGLVQGSGFYTAPGVQPEADLSGWKAYMDMGEPYDGDPQAQQMLDEIHDHHSSYYIDHSVSPAPMMISAGFTDDLFPANEATRFYNRTRAQYPNSPFALFFGSLYGHARGQSKAGVNSALNAQENAWVDYYLKGTGSQPASNVTTYTQTCPDPAVAGGPYVTSDWASQSPGEIRVVSDSAQTVAADSGDTAVAAPWNPGQLVGPKPCVTAPAAKEAGTANYETEAAPAGGYTLMGSPTVIARITQAGTNSQIAARIVDISADGTTKTLINRGLWRPAGSGFQVFQLNPNGWHVDQGHVLRLELLAKDAGGLAAATLTNFGRPSNNQQPATIENLELRIPVVETPGALGGLVKAPAKKVLPTRDGVELAPGYSAIGSESVVDYGKMKDPCPAGTIGTSPPDCVSTTCPTGQIGTPPNRAEPIVGSLSLDGTPIVKGKVLIAKVKCQIGNDSCSRTNLKFVGAPKKGKKGKGLVIAKGNTKTARSGQVSKVTMPLTKAARKFFKDKKVRKNGKKRIERGPRGLRAKAFANGKRQGFVTVKRVARVR